MEQQQASQTDVSPRSQQTRNAQEFSQRSINIDKDATMKAHLTDLKSRFFMAFSVFSKTKFDETNDDEELLRKAKARFSNSMPLKHIDIVLVQSLEEP